MTTWLRGHGQASIVAIFFLPRQNRSVAGTGVRDNETLGLTVSITELMP